MDDILRPAPEKFVSDGMVRIKLLDGDKSLIYAVTGKDTPHKLSGFEVWRKIIAKRTVMRHANNQIVPRRVKKPSSKDFGNTAWATSTLEVTAFYHDNMENGLNNYGVEWGDQVQTGIDHAKISLAESNLEVTINQIKNRLHDQGISEY